MAAKGQVKTGGRQRGTPNKTTRDVKEMILGALNAAGEGLRAKIASSRRSRHEKNSVPSGSYHGSAGGP